MDNYKKQVEEFSKEVNNIISDTDISLNKKLNELNTELFNALKNEEDIEQKLEYANNLLTRYKEQVKKNLKHL